MKWLRRLLKKQGTPVKNKWLIMLLSGLLLLTAAIPVSDQAGREKEKKTENQTEKSTKEDYVRTAEKRLSETLSDIEGAGKVRTMVTLAATSERVVEKDTETAKEEGRESRKEVSVYEETDRRGQTPYVTKELSPAVEGVVVIAQGGDEPVVVQNITEAVQALFGVESHKIKVVKMKQEIREG